MPMGEARIWTHTPEEEACTQATTDPPGCTDPTWAPDDPTAPRSPRSLRRHQRKTQTETHLCEGFARP